LIAIVLAHEVTSGCGEQDVLSGGTAIAAS
jgi:hypothetical protein